MSWYTLSLIVSEILPFCSFVQANAFFHGLLLCLAHLFMRIPLKFCLSPTLKHGHERRSPKSCACNVQTKSRSVRYTRWVYTLNTQLKAIQTRSLHTAKQRVYSMCTAIIGRGNPTSGSSMHKPSQIACVPHIPMRTSQR
jgi:hypothetical protein